MKIKRISIEDIKRRDMFLNKAGELLKDYQSVGRVVDGNEYLEFDLDDIQFKEIKQKYESNPPTPGMAVKIKNGLQAGYRIGKNMMQGHPIFVSEGIREQRQKICEGCEFYNNKEKACSVCGCSCNSSNLILNKTKYESEKCPKNKW